MFSSFLLIFRFRQIKPSQLVKVRGLNDRFLSEPFSYGVLIFKAYPPPTIEEEMCYSAAVRQFEK